MSYSCHCSYMSRVGFATASTWTDATGARGQNACLHAKQDGNVVAYAARALFAPRQDFPHQAVMNLVLSGPLADRDALVIQPSTCLNMSTKFFHGKISVVWCEQIKANRRLEMEQYEVVFSPTAEVLVRGYEGVVHFDVPVGGFCIGDTVRLRFAPDMVEHQFVCIARHFDYAKGAKPVCRLTLSLEQ